MTRPEHAAQPTRETADRGNGRQSGQRRDVRGSPEPQGDEPSQPEKKARSTAEWVSIFISIAIVLAFAVTVGYVYLTRSNAPPTIDAQLRFAEVRQEAGLFYLPIEVTNSGGDTAEDARIVLTQDTGRGQSETIDFQIRFLAGGETQTAVIAFHERPTPENTRVSAVSYLET